ncbi:hypothetical protein CASFOL_013639 [Castilleja foliolosa]|uniref:Uncharacterized protein n=1 Tax=Castilleja foliolosa TaxID=1961234 RepID=A0ABD3DLR8_9LAMI
MEFRKLTFIGLFFLPFIFAKVTRAEDPVRPEGSTNLQHLNSAVTQSEAAALELQQLNSRISSLETSIEDQTGDLNKKDGGIKQLEKVIEEKSNSLASLQSKVQLLQGKGSLELKDRVGKVDTRVNELEKQVISLKKEIEAQNKKKEELEARANAAEKKIEGLNLKLENLRRINDEQKSRIRNAQDALQLAEEEMLRAKLEASSLTKHLKEVHLAWLPLWVSAHLVHVESFVLTHWNDIGRPAFDRTIQEAIKQKYEVEKWVRPHLETMKTVRYCLGLIVVGLGDIRLVKKRDGPMSKFSPAIKQHYDAIVNDFYPFIHSLSTQALDYYHLTWIAIKPHTVRILETMDPYFQETKMFMRPHIDQILQITKPHLDKARLILKPYTKKVVCYHKKITEHVRVYHSRIQATLHETLNSYNLTKPLATEGLIRFMASILMLLPLIVLFRILVPRKGLRSIAEVETTLDEGLNECVQKDNFVTRSCFLSLK